MQNKDVGKREINQMTGKKAPVLTFLSTFIDFSIAYPRLVNAHEQNV